MLADRTEKHTVMPVSPFRGVASLVAQLVKNLPAMQETWVRFLGWEDSLEKEMATQLVIPLAIPKGFSCLENPMVRGSMGSQESDTTE